MAQQDWQKVKDIFVDAMQQKPEIRQEFLEDACKDDEEIRREVESLLSSYDEADSFMEVPAVVETGKTLIVENSQFTNGQSLRHYNIIEQIGKGGMGEVYLAKDTRLKRKVALKLLSTEFTDSKDLLRRFEQEAFAASSLNHPNILTIYEFGNTEDLNFIVTEFVDGKTLNEKLRDKHLMNLSEILDITIQTTSALVTAHEAGIIHRDIKPDNIMIRKDGIVKILDFGLAKLTERKIDEDTGLEATTFAKVKTTPGLVMGTPQYMSPEQASGKEVDVRGDIFSLGVVLYQMLSGKLPFEGESTTEIISSILKDDPKPLEDNEVPPQLIKIFSKTLQKDKNERYQTAKDFLVVLKSVQQELELKNKLGRKSSPNKEDAKTQCLKPTTLDNNEQPQTQIQKPETIENVNAHSIASGEYISHQIKTHKLGAIFILSIFLIAPIAFIYWYYTNNLNSSPLFGSIQVSPFTHSGTASNAAISPDGRFIVFLEKAKLIVKQIATGTTVEVVPQVNVSFPFQPVFSVDGEYIYYVLNAEGIGTLYRVSTLGGRSKKLIVDIDSKVSVSPDGKRLAFLRLIPDEGKSVVCITDNEGKELKSFISTKEVGYGDFMEVFWSRDNKNLIIMGKKNTDEQKSQKISFFEISFDEKRTLSELNKLNPINEYNFHTVKNFEWLKDNSGVIFLGKKTQTAPMQIWALTFSSGNIQQITNDTNTYSSLSVSNDMNTLVTTKGDYQSQLVSYNPKTKQLRQVTNSDNSFLWVSGFSQMLDGRLLYPKEVNSNINIFSSNEDGSSEAQLTFEGNNFYPIASPDGKYIVFQSNRGGHYIIWRMNSNGSNKVELTKFNAHQPDFTKDGKTVVFTRPKSDDFKSSLMKVSIDGGEATPLLPKSKTEDSHPKISPDGKKIAYFSYSMNDESKQVETFLKIHSWDGNNIGDMLERLNWTYDNNFFNWMPDNKSIFFLTDGGSGLATLLLESKKKKTLLPRGSQYIWNALWSNDRKRLFIVRGKGAFNLVLIRNKIKD